MSTRAAGAVPARASSTAPHDGLVAMSAALRAGPDMRTALRAVAATISQTLRWRTVVINAYRPAFHEFEVIAVHGDDGARATLLGQRTPAEEWEPLLEPRFRRRDAYFIPQGSYDWNGTLSYVPPIDPAGGPDAWHPEDALFVPLRSSQGATLGILSVDEPADGRRPGDADLDVLAAVAAQAGLVIESAQHAEAASRLRAEVQHLLRVSTHMTGRASPDEVLQAVCEGIRDGLGFERVATMLVDRGSGRLDPATYVGFDDADVGSWPSWYAGDLGPLLEHEREGCVLLTRERALSLLGADFHLLYASQRNGRGPRAWDRHWLIVPLHGEDGSLLGIVWADDPADRLLPDAERLAALRAFANQAAVALEAARAAERLRFLAEHDPMTGLRNRRNLHAAIDAAIGEAGSDGVALVVADVDAFKRINDELGYETGDAVLRHVARAVREACPPGGLAARLGGEEFAVVLPRTGLAGGRMTAEALRRAAPQGAGLPWALSLSVGLAVTGDDCTSAEPLLQAATRALVAAKRLGRDRCVVYDPATVEPLLAALGREDARSAHHLSAVMLLAETLDLRDAGTARHSETVGRYARDIAAALGFDAARVERMRLAGILHDIGKLAVADAILHKPGPLSDDERLEVQRHSEIGARILSHAGLADIAGWVLAHHERWDGGGYPHGRAADDIPLEARVLAVADAYEAMTAPRAYRPAPLSVERARHELRRHAGTQFDARVVDVFLRVAP